MNLLIYHSALSITPIYKMAIAHGSQISTGVKLCDNSGTSFGVLNGDKGKSLYAGMHIAYYIPKI